VISHDAKNALCQPNRNDKGDWLTLNKYKTNNAIDGERIEAVEKYFDEHLRDGLGGLYCEHKNVDGKNIVHAHINYTTEDGEENPNSIESITLKGNSEEFESIETIKYP
jgi:hypothetical protein